jgi:hypothetical protein
MRRSFVDENVWLFTKEKVEYIRISGRPGEYVGPWCVGNMALRLEEIRFPARFNTTICSSIFGLISLINLCVSIWSIKTIAYRNIFQFSIAFESLEEVTRTLRSEVFQPIDVQHLNATHGS